MPQSLTTGNYYFPVDLSGKAGAVVELTSGNFVVPSVLYASDGATLITSGNGLPVNLIGTGVMQPVDIQGIYYKTSSGYDALPIYSPDGITPSYGIAMPVSIPVVDVPMLYNNSNYDRQHNNFQASAIATTTSTAVNVTGGTFTNYNARGVSLFLAVNTLSGGTSPSIGFQVNTLDTASNKWFPLFSANAVNSIGMYQYQIYPAVTQNGLLAGAMNAVLPRQWQVVSSLSGSPTSVSYSIGYNYIL